MPRLQRYWPIRRCDEEAFPRERRTPEVLGELVRADAEKWWPIIKEARIKVE
jgi:hypothetical protein